MEGFLLRYKNNLSIKNKKVIEYYATKNCYKIITEDKEVYFAEKIYDSRSTKKKRRINSTFFWNKYSNSRKKFDKNNLTLMYFTKEENILHFIYVLPFDEKKALVESTVFSKQLFDESWYRDRIKKYLKDLKIDKFVELSIEKAVIPMFFAAEKIPNDPNIFNIGIRGGACKPSTGYAFSFLIKQIQLLKKTNKNYASVHGIVENKMDKIFLDYLKYNNEDGSAFIKLAKNLSGREFQNFMMGQSSILTKLKVIKSMPKLQFIKTLFT